VAHKEPLSLVMSDNEFALARTLSAMCLVLLQFHGASVLLFSLARWLGSKSTGFSLDWLPLNLITLSFEIVHSLRHLTNFE
jgi:hypothetical protein